MSDRLVRILGGVLLLLILAWLAARFVAGRGETTRSAALDMAAAADAIDSVVVSTATDTVRLRAGEPWTVNGHQAVPDAGTSLQNGLRDARLGPQVSRNPANHERLGVDDGHGRRFTVYSGGEPRLTLIVGQRAGAFDEYYMRRDGADDVYVLKGALANLANRKAADWRDREIFAAERASVQRIEFTYPDESFALVRDSANWRLEPPGDSADAATVSTLLGQLTTLRAIGFAADSLTAGLDWEHPAARLVVRGTDGGQLGELLFLENQDVGYFVRRADSPVVYSASSYTGEQILKREAQLKTGAAAP